jgi:hypothetical protein
MANNDLLKWVTSDVDFYELLGIAFENYSESELRRAYRKTALKYHPDPASGLADSHATLLRRRAALKPSIRKKARNTKIATFRKLHQISTQHLKVFKIVLRDRKEADLTFVEFLR